jgi:HAD superfamily hydrolase (TIGR01490 family)
MVKKIAAFFDVDHTILARASGTLYVKYLHQMGLASRWDIVKSLYWLILYKVNLIDMLRVTNQAMKTVEGWPEARLVETCDQWFEVMVKQWVYPEAVELIRKHERQGHEVAILTAATVYLGRPLSGHLGLKNAICTRLEVKGETLTGRVVEPMCYGAGKIYWAKRFCEEKGVDLSGSYFYTDSITDLDLLERVGHQVVVNPDPLLRREAVKRGWPIINFKPLNPEG